MQEDLRATIGVMGLLLVALFAAFCVVAYQRDKSREERDDLRSHALKSGIAEYQIVDESTGKTEFVWIYPEYSE